MDPINNKEGNSQGNITNSSEPSQELTGNPPQTPPVNTSPAGQTQVNPPGSSVTPNVSNPPPTGQMMNNQNISTEPQVATLNRSPQAEPKSKKKGGIITIFTILSAFIGIGLIGYFIYTQTLSGVVEYESAPLIFTSGETSDVKSLQLVTENNPYRPQVTLKYSKSSGISAGRETLATYNLTITDASQQTIYQQKSSFSYSDSSSDDSSNKDVTTSTNLKDFQIEDPGSYQLNFAADVPEDLDSDFTLESIQFRLRSQVISAPAWILLPGILSIVLSVVLVFLKRRMVR